MDAYFRKQLRVLRDDAAKFAGRHPALAPMLLKQGSDPDVERILEGTAYLCAQIDRRLDTLAPRMASDLLNLISPQYLLPMPSTTVMKFDLPANAGGPVFLPRGSQVESVPIDQQTMIYSTERELNILPLAIKSVEQTTKGGITDAVTVSFATDISLRSFMPPSLELYLPGTYANASQRMYVLLRFLDHVELEVEGMRRKVLPASCVALYAALTDDMRLTGDGASRRSYVHLLRFLHAPEELLFVTVKGLDSGMFSESDRKFTLRFILRPGCPDVPTFDMYSFSLNAVTAINLFHAHAEPIRLDHTREGYALRPQVIDGRDMEIIGVERADALMHGGMVRPCHSFNRWTNREDGLVYAVRIETAAADTAPEYTFEPLYMRQDRKFSAFPMDAVISAELLCCNHFTQNKLRAGDVCRPTDTSPMQATFSNITTPTRMIPRPDKINMYWMTLGSIVMNFLSDVSAEGLRNLLECNTPAQDAAPEIFAVDRKRWSAITEFTAVDEERLFKGRLFRGKSLRLTVDSQGFVSTGDIFLFADAIDKLLADYIGVNMYSRLSLSIIGRSEEIQWPPRLGDQCLL